MKPTCWTGALETLGINANAAKKEEAANGATLSTKASVDVKRGKGTGCA